MTRNLKGLAVTALLGLVLATPARGEPGWVHAGGRYPEAHGTLYTRDTSACDARARQLAPGWRGTSELPSAGEWLRAEELWIAFQVCMNARGWILWKAPMPPADAGPPGWGDVDGLIL